MSVNMKCLWFFVNHISNKTYKKELSTTHFSSRISSTKHLEYPYIIISYSTNVVHTNVLVKNSMEQKQLWQTKQAQFSLIITTPLPMNCQMHLTHNARANYYNTLEEKLPKLRDNIIKRYHHLNQKLIPCHFHRLLTIIIYILRSLHQDYYTVCYFYHFFCYML